MDKLRLLLRSVYLKGHQDGNLKTSDMSWEDKIVKDILKLFEEIVGEDRETIDSIIISISQHEARGYNQAKQEIRNRVKEEGK